MLLDLRMPDVDGWAVLEELRATSSVSRMPVIVFSAYADPATIRKSKQLGARGYRAFAAETGFSGRRCAICDQRSRKA